MQCPVCLGAVQGEARTPCGHSFCAPCLANSLTATQGTCPMCRKDVPRYTVDGAPGSVVVLRLGRAPAPLPAPPRARWRAAMLWPLLPLGAALWMLLFTGSGCGAGVRHGCAVDGAFCVYGGERPLALAPYCDEGLTQSCRVGPAECHYSGLLPPPALRNLCFGGPPTP